MSSDTNLPGIIRAAAICFVCGKDEDDDDVDVVAAIWPPF
jgi:hypothetical protein